MILESANFRISANQLSCGNVLSCHSGMERMLRRARLPVLLRQVVLPAAVAQGIDRQRPAIEREIIRSLADPANGFAARLCQSLSQTLGGQLEEMARGAEMSICA